MKRYVIFLLLLSVLLSGCAPKQAAPLEGTWKLTAYGPRETPTPAVTDTEATLTFDGKGNVTGNGGCNSLGGTYQIDANKITFREVVSTLMACDDARMAQEGAITQVLSGTAEYMIKDNTLTLTNADNVLIFVAVK